MTGTGLLAALALTTALVAPTLADARSPKRRPAPAQPAPEAKPILPATSYTLPNGLKVIFHIDRSDPVVSVALAAHVGSSRETPGRTGFAHMFEHLFFLDSENLGPRRHRQAVGARRRLRVPTDSPPTTSPSTIRRCRTTRWRR